MLDFAVNVRTTELPSWLVERLAARLADLSRYPSTVDEQRAIDAVAARHGRGLDEVALLAGAAEGFALLANLRPTLAALIAPSFTEPEAALSAAGVELRHVVLAPPYDLADAVVPEDADLVVVGNPTNPTSVLHSRDQILGLRRPGRIVVVDEAFADAVPGEPESLAGHALQLEAIAACCTSEAVAEADAGARRLAQLRVEMVAGLTAVGLKVVDGCAPFVLFSVPDAELLRKRLDAKGIAVRRCDTFVGLDGQFLRAAVRPDWRVLVDAVAEVLR